jgi:hypothetical protein
MTSIEPPLALEMGLGSAASLNILTLAHPGLKERLP